MTLHARVLVDTIDGAPGGTVSVPVRIVNESTIAAPCRVAVVGLDPSAREPPAESVVVEPNSSLELRIVAPVPASLGLGQHKAAIEVAPQRPDDRPLLAPFTVSIASVAGVALTSRPATIRGHRRASFKVDVVNNDPAPVELTLSGEAPGVRVRFREANVRIPATGRVVVPAKVKGPRLRSGEQTQHNVVLTATSRASSVNVTTPYVQRALVPHRARALTAAVTVVALWLGAIGAFAYWRTHRAESADHVAMTDTDGDGVNDQFVHSDGRAFEGSDTNGDGVLDTFEGDNGAIIRYVDDDGDGEPDRFEDPAGNRVEDPTGGFASHQQVTRPARVVDADAGPTAAVVRGTVKGAGDPRNVLVTLCPIDFHDGICPPAPIRGFVGARPEASKIWPARQGLTNVGTLNAVRQTETIEPPPSSANPKTSGVWQFSDVAIRQTYQIDFAQEGFDSQAFVVTPPEDGSPVVLDVVMEAAEGEISGVVSDRNGPLGGVAITVTDGTLTFNTTSTTDDNGKGTWSVTGVSTPGEYTVSADLRGYGSEVTQVKLKASEKLSGVDLEMDKGIGSIGGHVTSHGAGLGGVTVTVTNGEFTSSTTSLTSGDIGRYSIPKLPFGKYTVLVEAPNYVPQTARLEVNGDVEKDFSLSRTTVRLTGRVTDSRTGAGIPNAGLTLKTGNLTFKSVTGVSPNPGTFDIDNLPPGNYTITVEHYQHVTSTRLITLRAGVSPVNVNIELERSENASDIGRGSLVVEVVDQAGDTAAKRQVKNATVQLIRTRTGEALPPVTQEAFNFRLTDIPIGTYTLLVTAPRYNPAPPRLVSIGLSEQRVEVQLLKLGQASGRVVDSLTKLPLTDYFVTLFRQPENPGDAPVFTLAANSSGLWQTPPDSLIPGTYRIEISDAASPSGYLVRNDQLLDQDVVGEGDARLMRFVLPEDNDEPITVADIEADPYPKITGRIYRPTLTDADVGYRPVDRNDLAVTMSCPGGIPTAATLSDAAGVRGASPPLFDSFTITPAQIDSANLVGDCTLGVSAGPGLEAREIALPGVDASNGVNSADRRLHIALAPPAPAIGGEVFWLDGTDPVAIENATVSAVPITRFDVVESASASADPDAVPTPVQTTSDINGTWDINGQVWGIANYLFEAPDFAPGTVAIKVDDSGASATSVGGTVVNETADGRFRVQLSAPHPRTLCGEITIKSSDGSFAFDQIVIKATGPTRPAETITEPSPPGVVDIGDCKVSTAVTSGDSTAIERGTPTNGVLPFRIVNAEPGTWSVDIVDVPANHDEFGTRPVEQQVPPGSTPYPSATDDFKGFNISLVELATLSLTLTDVNGTAPVTVRPRVKLTPDPAVPGIAPIDAILEPIAVGSNTFVLSGIKVDPADPENTAMNYDLSVSVPGYDVTRAKVDGIVVNECGVTDLDVDFLAGSTTSMSLALPKFGRIEGNIVGIIDDQGTQEGPPGFDMEADGDIIVTRVGPATTCPIIDATLFEPTVDPTVNSYVITAPPGYYEIELRHPQFTAALPLPGDHLTATRPNVPPEANPVLPPVANQFRILNETLNQPDDPATPNQPDDFVMNIIKGHLNISVFESLTAQFPVAVDGATYILKQNGVEKASGTVENPAAGADPDDFGPNETDLHPGDYSLEIHKFTDPVNRTGDEAFTVITVVTIQRAVDEVAATTTVRAPLPLVQASVTGSITAENQNGDPVELPILTDAGNSITYHVTSTYDSPTIEVNNSTKPNQNDPVFTDVIDFADGIDATGIAQDEFEKSSAAAGTIGYTLSDLPIGNHSVEFETNPADALTGYTPEGDNPAALLVDALRTASGPNFRFTVQNVTLTIQLTAGFYPDANTIVLTSPDNHQYGFDATTTYEGTTRFDEDTGVITISDVAPEIGDFKLDFADALHDAVDDALIQVHPDTDGDDVPEASASVPTTATKGRVQGTASQNSKSGSTGLVGPASIKLVNTTTTAEFPVNANSTVDNWFLDVPPGTYVLETTKAGFATQTLTGIVVTAGAKTIQNVQVSQLSKVTVVVANASTLTSPSVTLNDGNGGTTTVSLDSSFKATFTDVVPATYTISAKATNYRATDLTTETVGVGDDVTFNVTLPRKLEVTVTGPAQATVKVLSSATGAVVAQKTAATSSPFAFSSAESPPAIPGDTSDLVLQVEATGYMTQRVEPIAFELDKHDLQVVLRLPPTVEGVLTDTSGVTITKNKVAGTISATSDGTVKQGSVDGNGKYTIPGLGVGPNGENRTWTLFYDKTNVGTSSGADTVTIVATDTTPVSGPDIMVTPRTIKVTFTVYSDVTLGPIQSAIVDIAGLQIKTNSAGKASVNLDEDLENVGWSVSFDRYVTQSGTIASFPNRSELQVPQITLVSRARSVVVQDAGVGIVDASVSICTIARDAQGNETGCTNATSLGLTKAASSGTPPVVAGQLDFLAPTAAGSYRITAIKDTLSGILEFTVDSTGKASLNAANPPVIEIDPPPDPSSSTDSSTDTGGSSTGP